MSRLQPLRANTTVEGTAGKLCLPVPRRLRRRAAPHLRRWDKLGGTLWDESPRWAWVSSQRRSRLRGFVSPHLLPLLNQHILPRDPALLRRHKPPRALAFARPGLVGIIGVAVLRLAFAAGAPLALTGEEFRHRHPDPRRQFLDLRQRRLPRGFLPPFLLLRHCGREFP